MNRDKYLIVGAGLFGSIVARELTKAGKNVFVVERHKYAGGTVYTKNTNGIPIHLFGAHIFRTSEKWVWDYFTQFGEFNHYIHSPLAMYKGNIYNLPINMNTFHELWGVRSPDEAREALRAQRVPCPNPKNLEEYALSVVGKDVYNTLIKGYTEKQWGRPCSELPVSTMRRIPIRFTYDNNYYSGKMYQGVPIKGYSPIINKMLGGAKCTYGVDGKELVKHSINLYDKIIYTGCIDEFFDYIFGCLEYRTLTFRHDAYMEDNYLGNSVINYTSNEQPYTRLIEHKHFIGADIGNYTVVTTETPGEYCINNPDNEPYYPILNGGNIELYNRYVQHSREIYGDKIIFCGRLGSYRYVDMEDTIKNALITTINLLKSE